MNFISAFFLVVWIASACYLLYRLVLLIKRHRKRSKTCSDCKRYETCKADWEKWQIPEPDICDEFLE